MNYIQPNNQNINLNRNEQSNYNQNTGYQTDQSYQNSNRKSKYVSKKTYWMTLILSVILILGIGVATPFIYNKFNTTVSTNMDATTLFNERQSTVVRIETSYGQGSGTIITPEGDILTNMHVISDLTGKPVRTVAVTVTVGEKEYQIEGRVEMTNEDYDLAIVRLNQVPQGMEYSPIKSADNVAIGETVYIVGFPLSQGKTITQGIITEQNVDLTDFFETEVGIDAKFFKTDATINAGNSGGAMFDSQGYLIGIPTLKTYGGSVENTSFAIQISDIVDELGDLNIEYHSN